jgi:MFS family permease
VVRRSGGGTTTRASLRSVLRGRLGKVAAVAGLLGVLTISDGFLYLSLQQRDDLAAQYFPLLFVGTNVAFFTFAIPLGRLSDRIGRHRVFIAGHLLLVGAYACAVGSSGGLLLTVACLALLGSFYAATDGVLSALVAGIAPASARAQSLAAVQTVVAVSRFASSILFGLLWSQLGRGPAVLCFAVALVAALPLARILLRTAQPSGQDRMPAGAAS